MGVRMLNTLIKKKYIKNPLISFENLKGKKIAIDTNLYIYKYTNYGNLIETFYKLCNLFLKYEIIPVFVFDGITPDEKKEEVLIRKEKKYEAQKEYDELTNKLSTITDVDLLESILCRLKVLKSQCVKVKKVQVLEIKKLIEGFGLNTIVAPDEGEKLCSYLMINHIIDGVITEDSDVYVYGCNKVYRNISFSNETILEIDYNTLLDSLYLSRDEFMYLCILSNNDYNKCTDNIIENYNLWLEYKKDKEYNESLILMFIIEFFKKETITLQAIINMKNIYSFYNSHLLSKYNRINLYNRSLKIKNIKNIMENNEFVFI